MCVKDHDFPAADFPPPFYKCAQDGAWDPVDGAVFRFPACASKQNYNVAFSCAYAILVVRNACICTWSILSKVTEC